MLDYLTHGVPIAAEIERRHGANVARSWVILHVQLPLHRGSDCSMKDLGAFLAHAPGTRAR